MWLSILSWRNRKKIAMEGIDYVWGTDYSDKNINKIPPRNSLYNERLYWKLKWKWSRNLNMKNIECHFEGFWLNFIDKESKPRSEYYVCNEIEINLATLDKIY